MRGGEGSGSDNQTIGEVVVVHDSAELQPDPGKSFVVSNEYSIRGI